MYIVQDVRCHDVLGGTTLLWRFGCSRVCVNVSAEAGEAFDRNNHYIAHLQIIATSRMLFVLVVFYFVYNDAFFFVCLSVCVFVSE